jgi:uncharacterized protein YkvS
MSPWQMINTVDFFVYDESKKGQALRTKIKDKNFVLRPARTGVGYIGLRIWPNYYEFAVVTLDEPLKSEDRYYFEMYVIISNHSNCYLRSLGASFYSVKPPYNQREGLNEFSPQIEIYSHNGLRAEKEWIKISGVFEAKGGERIVTIGTFATNNRLKFKTRKFSLKKREAYYYIDDVALFKLDKFGFPMIEAPIEQIDSLNNDSVIVEKLPIKENLENIKIDKYYKKINFPIGSSELTYEEYEKIGYVIEYMSQNEDVKLNILGYSGKIDNNDNTEQYKIAQKRAKSVFLFISGNKINRNRLIVNQKITGCYNDLKKQESEVPCNSVELFFSNDEDDNKRLELLSL